MLAPTAALALFAMHGMLVAADQPQWDCRAAPGGTGWICTKDGGPFIGPPDMAVTAPASRTSDSQAAEAPAAVPPPSGTAETATAEQRPPQTVDEGSAAPVQDVVRETPAPAPPPEPAAEPAQPEEPDQPAEPASTQTLEVPPDPQPVTGPPATLEPDQPVSPPGASRATATAPAAPARQSAHDTLPAEAPVSASQASAPKSTVDEQAAGAEATALQTSDAGQVAVDLPGPGAPPAPPEPAPTTDVKPEPPPDDPASATPLSDAGQAFAGALDAGIDWHSCRAIGPAQAPELSGSTDDLGEVPLAISADAAVFELDPEIARFSGDVELVHGSLELQTAELTLDRAQGEASAAGGVLIANPDVRIAGSSARYRLGPRTGEVIGASYRLPSIHARGDASEAALLGDAKSRYRQITYTTCSPDSDDWLLTAESLELDHAEGLGTAKSATLRFFGVPLLYAPTFTFPIDDRRRSGFLPPKVGSSANTGADISVPYYLNLAPNYDLTLVPRLMAKRGIMLGGEFRFLTESSSGELAAEFLPNDSDYSGNSTRGGASLNSITRFNDRLSGKLRLNYVSDDDYLKDLGDSIAVTSKTNLERTGELTYRGDDWGLLARAQHYQNLDDTLTGSERPYSRLPQVRVDLQRPDVLGGTTLHLDAEYANFYRSGSVRGHRLDMFPALSLPLADQWWYLEPKAGARYTAYRLSDTDPGEDDSPSELSGLVSLDGGLLFDRSTDYFGSAATQTLEPRLFYLLVPTGDQDDQPVFDTGLLGFGFDNLFRENRFSGADRFGDANQLTLALTSRVLGASGEELLRASIGQIYYFEDREVTLPDEPEPDDSSSALVIELDAALGSGWRSRAGMEWDPHDGDKGTIDKAAAQLTYRDEKRQRFFSAAYRLRDGVTNQTDLGAVWPLNEQVRLIGRHYHSLREDRLLEALAGIEYGRCCWQIRAVARRFVDGTGDDYNTGVQLQLVLNGLGRLGQDIDETLERGIYGYQ